MKPEEFKNAVSTDRESEISLCVNLIKSQNNQLNEMLNALHDMIGTHSDRLAPIVSQKPPQPTKETVEIGRDSDVMVPEVYSVLGENLMTVVHQADELQGRVNSAIRRIQSLDSELAI